MSRKFQETDYKVRDIPYRDPPVPGFLSGILAYKPWELDLANPGHAFEDYSQRGQGSK